MNATMKAMKNVICIGALSRSRMGVLLAGAVGVSHRLIRGPF
jgi:hypothetical protein